MARKNYTAREKEELKTIVEKYKDIIENKSTNAQLIAKKMEAWDAVATEFNSSAQYPRTVKQLLALYNNMKRPTRQDLTIENKEIRATGGDTFTPALGAADARMLCATIMGPQIQPLNNDVDIASVYHNVDSDLNEDLHEEASVSKEPSKELLKLTQNGTKKKPRTMMTFKEKNEILKKNIYVRKLQTAGIEKKEALVKLRIAQKQERLIDMDIKIKELQLQNLQNQVK